HLTPTIHKQPPNKSARALVVAEISRQGAKKEPDVLVKRVHLVLQRLARPQKIPANFAIHFKQKTRLRFVIGVIGGEKISEQFSIFIHGINRVAEKSGIAAELSYRFAVRSAIATNEERIMVVARHLKLAVVRANLAINAKQFLKYALPAIKFFGCARGGLPQSGHFFRTKIFDRIGQRFQTVLLRPRFLVVTNNLIHVTPANSHYGCAACLTFQRHKSKCFLNAWMNEKIGSAIVTGEINGVCAV